MLKNAEYTLKSLWCSHHKILKHVWPIFNIIHERVKPLKNKKAKTVFHGFIEIVNESKHKPNKSWVDQGKWVYKNLMEECLEDNDI